MCLILKCTFALTQVPLSGTTVGNGARDRDSVATCTKLRISSKTRGVSTPQYEHMLAVSLGENTQCASAINVVYLSLQSRARGMRERFKRKNDSLRTKVRYSP